MTKFKFIPFFLLVFLARCVSLQKASGSYIELQRTPCFGSCPDYTVTILPNGKVIFKGGGVVTEKGKKTDKVSIARVDSLFSLAQELDFFALPKNLDETCPMTVTDMPGTIITVKTSGEKHTVYEQACAVITDNFLLGYKQQVKNGDLSQTELDSLLIQNKKAENYLDRFHELANSIDSIATVKKWIHK